MRYPKKDYITSIEKEMLKILLKNRREDKGRKERRSQDILGTGRVGK
jgi:chemotaxis regulatin CheY-phosphate phosphatase CheZ